jgi:hypothetical protein
VDEMGVYLMVEEWGIEYVGEETEDGGNEIGCETREDGEAGELWEVELGDCGRGGGGLERPKPAQVVEMGGMEPNDHCWVETGGVGVGGCMWRMVSKMFC